MVTSIDFSSIFIKLSFEISALFVIVKPLLFHFRIERVLCDSISSRFEAGRRHMSIMKKLLIKGKPF
ncbi:hypothetical membrane protein [Syntrophus aciditrophicus SB]|uniref:Hypothetical membrane protein n=1 Tax=Syntrophus aciditrophicus (strain SB) TaxID=56780 RepID=Q2LTB5_SYNAS|nr:hypothetical membrane protein [Syntrophus aciditrophicus SB]